MSAKALLDKNQRAAVRALRPGSILCGGVGSGKSRTAIAYWLRTYGEKVPLYVITTPKKRDSHDWEREIAYFDVHRGYTIDSWNNIEKYLNVGFAFFIFDEQRLVGKGTWAKSFLKITKSNDWIVITATPGDTWMDYATIFIAKKFYKNRTEFLNRHAVFSRVSRYPMVEKWIEEDVLEAHRRHIVVELKCDRTVERRTKVVRANVPLREYFKILRTRYDPETGEPFTDGSALLYALRKNVGKRKEKLDVTRRILETHHRAIIFYNYNYERELLYELANEMPVAEWSGHKHLPIPEGEKWLYFVQYAAGAEGWECTKCDCIIFFSANYSYKIMEQAAGRIDRRNTSFSTLWYFLVMTRAPIDEKILDALRKKRNFNEKLFLDEKTPKFDTKI